MDNNEIKCKKCGKEINENDNNIYDGFCENCYNKWISKKEKHPDFKGVSFNENSSYLPIIAFLLGAVSIIISIIFLSSLPLLPAIALGIGLSGSGKEKFWFNFAFYFVIFFPLFTIALNIVAINKEKNLHTETGLALSIIATIIVAFCYSVIFH